MLSFQFILPKTADVLCSRSTIILSLFALSVVILVEPLYSILFTMYKILHYFPIPSYKKTHLTSTSKGDFQKT